MLAALASADAVTWLSIVVKAFAYAATLSAVGGVLGLVSLQALSEDGRDALRKLTVLSVIAAAVFTVLRLPVRASFLMGGVWDGALDPTILGMVTESPLGTSAGLRLGGLVLIFCVIWRGRSGLWLGLLGALFVSASFALRGHALKEPQLIVGALITVHILCLAFWIGAFAPLMRSTRLDPPTHTGTLAREFGRKALWAVGLLVLSGGVTLWLFGVVTPSVVSSPYGQMFAVKLVLFAGVLSLAGVNKLSLTPALLAAQPGAGRRLRRTIGVEATLVAAVLVTTAALTTVSSPPTDPAVGQASNPAQPMVQVQQSFGDTS